MSCVYNLLTPLYPHHIPRPPTESLMKESTSAADGGNHRERALGDYFLVYPPAPLSFPSKLKRYCSRATIAKAEIAGMSENIF